MKAIIVIAALLATLQIVQSVSDAECKGEFAGFIRKFNRNYKDQTEYETRYLNFKRNYEKVVKHNANPKKTWGMAINKFSDLSREEFRSQYLNFKKSPGPHAGLKAVDGLCPKSFPQTLDWRQKNAVTDVKDQGQCGSCWAFSATGTTEAAHAIAANNLTSLSEQNILDCTWNAPYNDTGCDGGDPRSALQYIIDNKGIDSESSYPYQEESDEQNCQYETRWNSAKISAMYGVITTNETDLQCAAVHGSVSVAIDAEDSFQNYDYGIYSGDDCSSDMDSLNHGVLVVGFDLENQFWIVKNSWGEDWGDGGYIEMIAGYNMCGIATYATLAIV